MKISIILTTYLVFALSAYANTTNLINLAPLLNPESDNFNDVGYMHLVPQYEENMKADKAVSIEYYFGEVDSTKSSLEKLNIIKEIIADDKFVNNGNRIEVISVSPNARLQNSSMLNQVMGHAGLSGQKIVHDQIPSFFQTSKLIKSKKQKRVPSAVESGRIFWSFVRMSSATAGTFGALYFMEGLAAPLAASVAIWPGIASGGITYFSNAYGSFLTNGKWSTWLLESDSMLAKGFRKGFNINEQSFAQALEKNKAFFQVRYPELVRDNPDLFEARVATRTREGLARSKTRIANFLSRLQNLEEYFKWWVTEVAFVGVAIKLPQAIGGVGAATSALGMASDVLVGSTMGMIAQGPGDIAIQVRKYQKIQELKDAVIAGTKTVENKAVLLEEIEKILAKQATISSKSHAALNSIENWARSRATLLSFFSVTGVALEIAGVPAGKPLLMAVGLFGMGYYANVQGWIKPSRLKQAFQNFKDKVRRGELGFSLQFLKSRYCGAKFQYKPKSLIQP